MPALSSAPQNAHEARLEGPIETEADI
jgi:hypothetical protein